MMGRTTRLAFTLATLVAGGCGHNSDIVLHFKQQPPPLPPCAMHDGLADFSVGTIAVLPFRSSDKDGSPKWKGPDGKELEEIVYPFADDGQRFAGLLQAAVAATRTYNVVDADQISEIVSEMGLDEVIATDTEMARQVAQVVGADAVIVGRVEAYRGELRHATIADEEEFIALYRGAVFVTSELVHAASGTVLANCQSGANSQAFLDKNQALTLDLLEEGDVWGKASHSKEIGGKVAYVAVQIAAEIAKGLTAGVPVREGEAGDESAGEDSDAAASSDDSGGSGNDDGESDTGAENKDDGGDKESGDDGKDDDEGSKDGDGGDKDDSETKDDTGEEKASDGDSNDGGNWREKMRKRQPHARPGM